MRTYSDRGKVKIKDLIWYIIVAFLLTSIWTGNFITNFENSLTCVAHIQPCNCKMVVECEVVA